jgi:hypothetical protein
MPGLPDDAGGAGGIHRPQDRAHVLGILDAVEHHNQGRPLGLANQFLHGIGRQWLKFSGNSLMNTASGEFVERPAIQGLDRNPQFVRPRD